MDAFKPALLFVSIYFAAFSAVALPLQRIVNDDVARLCASLVLR